MVNYKKYSFRAIISILPLLLCVSSLSDSYPKPQISGFHHCALIYETITRDSYSLRPYIVRIVDNKPTNDWLFDAFLYLTQRTSSGKRTEYGATDITDWQELIDRLFKNGDLEALDDAISDIAEELGVDGPPEKRKIIICIPWLSPECHTFGDVDDDGKTENLAHAEDQKKIVAWFIKQISNNWQKANYKHLELWGFYWMREDIVNDAQTVRLAADVVHSAGYKLLWIPYNNALGWDKWQDCNIDVAILQPNYAFGTSLDGGHIRRNRLLETASRAKQSGTGVEIEIRGYGEHPLSNQVFLEYLRDGYLYGYQQGTTAYYLGSDFIHLAYNSTNPQLLKLYHTLCDYILGLEIPEPSVIATWNYQKKSHGIVAETVLDSPTYISKLDVSLDLKDNSYSSLQVEIQPEPNSSWVPSGWAIAMPNSSTTSVENWTTIAVQAHASAIRVTANSLNNKDFEIKNIFLDTKSPTILPHKALNAAYNTIPAREPGKYPDAQYKLTDGKKSSSGFTSGLDVGWYLGSGSVAINFDLKEAYPIEKVVVYTEGGSYAGINWPQKIAAYVSNSPNQYKLDGLGSLPKDLNFLNSSNVQVLRSRSPIDLDGLIEFTSHNPLEGRYLTLCLEPNGWLMLSEVSIYVSGQKRPLTKIPYSTKPLPTTENKSSYPDNGIKLTDGVIAEVFSPDLLTGWDKEQKREFIIDLSEPTEFNKVTVWSLDGGLYGIWGPESVVISVSQDNKFWRKVGQAHNTKPPQRDLEPAPYTFTSQNNLLYRYVKVTVSKGKGWSMLSEIQID